MHTRRGAFALALVLGLTTLAAAVPVANNSSSENMITFSMTGGGENSPWRDDESGPSTFSFSFKEGDNGTRERTLGEWIREDFEFVKLEIGNKVKNKHIRCRLIDFSNTTVVVSQRKVPKIVDDSFGVGNWEWDRHNYGIIKKIVCDPAIKAAGPKAKQFQIILSDSKGGNVTSVIERDEVYNHGSLQYEGQSLKRPGPFTSVTLQVGVALREQDLRCQLIDGSGNVVVMRRGNTTLSTFSDYGRGAWTFAETKSKCTL